MLLAFTVEMELGVYFKLSELAEVTVWVEVVWEDKFAVLIMDTIRAVMGVLV